MKRLALVALALASILVASFLLLRDVPRAVDAVLPARPVEPEAEHAFSSVELTTSPIAPAERTPLPVSPEEVEESASTPFTLPAAPPASPDPPLRFYAVVLDGITSLPIPGAKAWIPGPAEAAAAEAYSDPAGRIELDLASSSGHGLGHVTADGYGKGVFVFDRAHDSPALAAMVELLPAAGLDVFAHDPEGRPLAECEVTLTWRGAPVLRGDFVLMRHERASWAERTDAGGVARFSDLNAETELAWRVRDPANSAWREGRLALALGERGRLDVELGGAARVSGRVRDENGAPLSEVRLFLAPESNGTHHGDHERMLRTASDATGAFEFLDVPFDGYRLGCEQNQQDIVAEEVTLVVDRARVEHDLEVSHGLFLSGRVVGAVEDFEGRESLVARRLDGEGFTNGKVVDGAFRIGPLAPGDYLVSASLGSIATAVVRAPAGASDVELPVLRSREIWLSVEGAAGAEYDLTLFDLERETGMLWNEHASRFSVELAQGRHTLQVTTADDRMGMLAELVVTADEPREELVVRMEPGALCTFVHRATSGTRTLRLFVGGQLYGLLELFGSDARLLPGASKTLQLPPGRLAVELLEGARVAAREELVLLPGERRRIELVPR